MFLENLETKVDYRTQYTLAVMYGPHI